METAGASNPNVTYIDCNEPFLNRKTTKIKEELMPDFLPKVNACAGMSHLADCYKAELRQLSLM